MQITKLIKTSKLRNRVLVLFSVLAVVPVLVLGATALYLIDLSHKHDVSQMEQLLLKQKTEEVDKFFADNLGVLELTVDIAESQNSISYSQQQFLLDGFLISNKAFEEVSFHNLDGRVTAKRSRTQGEVPPLGYLEPDTVASVKKNEKVISEVSYKEDIPTIDLATLIKRKDPATNKPGEAIYIVSAKTSLSSLVSSVERSGLGTSGYLIFTDDNGRLISEGSPANISRGEDVLHLASVSKVLASGSSNGLSEDDRYISPLVNTEVVSAGKTIPSTGWAMLVEWPVRDADAILQEVRNRVLLFTLTTLAVVLLLAPFAAARLINPIRKLEHAAKAIEKGEFDTKVDIKTGDELEDLGSTFNKMAKGLKRLEELKDEFVFVATHELRSPVTVIKGYLSMLKEGDAGKLSEPAEDMVNKANMANQRLAQLVNDLLEIARSEAGKLEIEVSPVDATQPIQASVEELQPLAEEKSIQFAYKNPGNVPKVLADNSRIKEVTVNLAGNAIKYTQEGGWVKVWHEVKNDMVITHIQDNGFGISKEAQKKLFQKFYRVQTDKTKSITGTGLGLFIVKQIIEKMNGKIWVESEEGKGSTFSFSLPIEK